MYNQLPSNVNISVFDFRAIFDLALGKIQIDLSPSVIQNPAAITGFKVSITTPNRTIIQPADYVFTPLTYTGTYQANIPKVQGVYVWGVYSLSVIMTLAGVNYTYTKTFNLCAANTDDPFQNDKTGEITLKLDCRLGVMYARNFSGYVYKNNQPSSEAYNITFYFPRETDLAPVKNINQMPFQVDAYVGENLVKGVNISTYDFGDNLFAKVKINATATKNARCDVDVETVFCALRSQLETLRSCPSDAANYTANAAEINALLWLIFVGIQSGDDMSDEITRLEDLLQVNCACSVCAGTKIGPMQYIACPQVSNAQITVDSDTHKLIVSFNSAGVPDGSALKVEYREFCDTSTSAPFTTLDPNPDLNGGNQVVQITIVDIVKYQVKLSVVKPDSTVCPPLIIESDNDADCPGGTDVIGDNPDEPVIVIPPGTTITEIPPFTLVDKIVIVDPNAINGFTIGITSGGQEKWPATDYNPGYNVLEPDIYTGPDSMTLYFGGTGLSTTIIIYLRRNQ